MPGATYICITDDTCPKPGHGKYIYFCRPCQEEWEQANPNTHEAIGKFARGEVGRSTVDAAKKKDRELRLKLSPPVEDPGDNP